MRLASRSAALACAAFLLSGCPDARQEEETGPPPVPEGAAAALPDLPLIPMEGSGITGRMRVTPRGGESVVTVGIAGAHPNAVYPVRIHTGRCSDQGVERTALEPIRTDGLGQGESQSVVQLPAHQLLTGRDYVQVYVARGELHQAVACGELPERPDLVPALRDPP